MNQSLNDKIQSLDLFSIKSHEKALLAWKEGKFDNEIVPVNLEAKNNQIKFDYMVNFNILDKR